MMAIFGLEKIWNSNLDMELHAVLVDGSHLDEETSHSFQTTRQYLVATNCNSEYSPMPLYCQKRGESLNTSFPNSKGDQDNVEML